MITKQKQYLDYKNKDKRPTLGSKLVTCYWSVCEHGKSIHASSTYVFPYQSFFGKLQISLNIIGGFVSFK